MKNLKVEIDQDRVYLNIVCFLKRKSFRIIFKIYLSDIKMDIGYTL